MQPISSTRRLALTLAPALAFLSLSVQADDNADQDKDDSAPTELAAADMAGSVPLNPVVVTATRTERKLDDSLSSVTVVDRATIERQQPRQFAELLRGRPGVDVVSNGPYGKATSVFLRGTSNNQSMLVVDGIRMGSATTGGPSWQFLPPQLIERVEIVRGPRGSVYGPDAIGGVVQVFTPQGQGEASPWVEVGGGSFSTREYGGGVSGEAGNTSYNIGAHHFQTDGIALREGGERRGYDNTSVVGRLSHEFGDAGELGVTSLHSEGTTQFIGGETDFVHEAIGATYDLGITRSWDSRFVVGRSLDEGLNRTEDGSESRFDTERQLLNWQNSIYAGDHEFVVGVDYLDDKVTSSTEYEEDSRNNTGTYVQALLDFAPASVELGLRNDDNESFGTVSTGSFAAGYQFSEAHRARLSWGEAFRAPSFNELYFPNFGNPDLDPEESTTTELGFSGLYDTWFWDASVYETEVENLIEFVFAGGQFAPQNVNEARIRGLELGTGLDLDAWTIYGSVSYTDPKDLETGKRLRRRTKQSARLEVDRELGDWSLGATVIAQSHRFNDAEGQERLPGFGLLNLRAGWDFADRWNARLTVDNALDRDYVTARDSFNGFDYQQPGRSVHLTLRYER